MNRITTRDLHLYPPFYKADDLCISISRSKPAEDARYQSAQVRGLQQTHTLKPPIEKHQKAQERDRIIGQKKKHRSNPARNLSQDHPGTPGTDRELMSMKEKASLWKLTTVRGVL